MTEILLCLYKPFVSYDIAKTKKISDFFALTWLIFAGLVTIMVIFIWYNYNMSVIGCRKFHLIQVEVVSEVEALHLGRRDKGHIIHCNFLLN